MWRNEEKKRKERDRKSHLEQKSSNTEIKIVKNEN